MKDQSIRVYSVSFNEEGELFGIGEMIDAVPTTGVKRFVAGEDVVRELERITKRYLFVHGEGHVNLARYEFNALIKSLKAGG